MQIGEIGLEDMTAAAILKQITAPFDETNFEAGGSHEHACQDLHHRLGLLAFVAIAFSAQVSSAQANYFSSEFGSSGDMTILVIATVMVGVNSIMGGFGSTLRSSLGAIFISTVDNMMMLHGFNSGPRVLAVGLMIVFSIIVFALVRRGSRVQE